MERLGTVVKGNIKRTSEYPLSVGISPVEVDRYIHVSRIAKNGLIATLMDDRHTVQVTKKHCVLKMQSNIVGFGSGTDGMYAVCLDKVGE